MRFLFAGMVLLSGIMQLAGGEYECILEDGFSRYAVGKVSPAAYERLKGSGRDVSGLEKTPVPQGWDIEWDSFPADCTFGKTDGAFLVTSETAPLTMRGPQVAMDGAECRLEFDLSAMRGGSMELGLEDGGMTAPGYRSVSMVFPKADKQTYVIDFSAKDQYSVVVPVVKIQGTVKVYGMRAYRRPLDGFTVAEGEVVERSVLPPPEKSDYPDCRYTLRFKGNSILAGVPCTRDLCLTVDGFRDYRKLLTDELKPGDKICVAICPFDRLPEQLKTIQLQDDLQLFDLDNYFVVSCRRIPRFADAPASPASEIMFAGGGEKWVSVFERRINPPVPAAAAETQKREVAAGLARMNSMLRDFDAGKDELNRRFNAAWAKNQALDTPGYNRVGDMVWRNVDNSFWALPRQYTLAQLKYVTDDNVRAMVSLKLFLEANGVQLIVQLVPHYHAIAARVMNPEFRDCPDYQTASVARQFLAAGIETLYPSDLLIENFNKYPFMFFYPSNPHPSDTCQDIMTSQMAARLDKYGFKKNMDAAKFSIELVPHTYKDNPAYRFPANCDIGANVPLTSYNCRNVLYDGKPVMSSGRSPVLILGSSYIQTPMNYPNSYPTLLAAKCRFAPDACGISGGTGVMTTILQNMFADPGRYLAGKKVVIVNIGVAHCLVGNRWNDIALMDESRGMAAGKPTPQH